MKKNNNCLEALKTYEIYIANDNGFFKLISQNNTNDSNNHSCETILQKVYEIPSAHKEREIVVFHKSQFNIIINLLKKGTKELELYHKLGFISNKELNNYQKEINNEVEQRNRPKQIEEIIKTINGRETISHICPTCSWHVSASAKFCQKCSESLYF